MLSVICVAGATNASADTDRVRFVSDCVCHVRASSYSLTHEVFIKTTGNAENEAVYLHHSLSHTDYEAELYKTLSDGSKIWRATYGGTEKYAIKYVADGVTYWDNNNGNDYTGQPVGVQNVTVPRRDRYDYAFIANLKNLAYEKNVFARYTTDNWATYHDIPLSYEKSSFNGAYETWRAAFPVDEITDYSQFEYAVCYQVNGQEYWANNFESNYSYNYEITTSYY